MHARTKEFVVVLFALAALFSFAPARQVAAQDSRCFPETGQCISGPIRTYWESNGGLPIFGFPITNQRQETIEGRSLQVQWFERDRIEIQANGSITTGRLGVDLLAQMGTPWQPGNKQTPDAGCVSFRETGHQVCGAFLTFWQKNGGLNRLGLPISGAFQTTIEGRNLTVQYFERRRFELHGPNQVMLGLLGREVLKNRGGGGTPPAQSCADVPEPVNGRIRPGKCFTAGTAISIDMFGFAANEKVGFWFNAPDGSTYGTVDSYDIGPTGAVNDMAFDTKDMGKGMWSFVMQGTSSGRKAIVYFKILGDTPPPPPPPSPPSNPPSATCADVPEPVNGRIRPGKCFAAGTTLSIDLFDFDPDEKVGFWFNAPDRSIYGTVDSYDVGPTGDVYDLTFDTSGMDKGMWSFVMEGTDSGHQAIVYFKIQ